MGIWWPGLMPQRRRLCQRRDGRAACPRRRRRMVCSSMVPWLASLTGEALTALHPLPA